MIETIERYSTGAQFAQDVMDTLAENDLRVDTEHNIALYLYVPTKNDANICAARIRAAGCECEVRRAADDSDNWLCYVTKTVMPNQDKLAPIGSLLIVLAGSFEGEFDGWELAQDESVDFAALIDFSTAAQAILASVQEGFSGAHEFVEADPADFDDLDLDFYNRTETELDALGFEFVADIEDKTVSNAGTVVTFFRSMWSAETNANVAFYYVPAMQAGIYDFETLLSDGSTVQTTISAASNNLADFPMLHASHHPATTSVADLYRTHLEDVDAVIAGKPACEKCVVNSFQSIVASQSAMAQLKHEHLKRVGWVTQEYLLAQTGGDEATATAIYAAIQKILAERGEAPAA